MLRKTRSLAQELLTYAGAWGTLGGTTISGIVVGWVAYATKILKPYAPVSWVLAAFVGAIFFCLVLLLAMQIWNASIRATASRRFYESGERINPTQNVFQAVRVKISDLTPPVGQKITGKTFVDCEIVGPSNIVLSGTTRLTDSGFDHLDCIILNGHVPVFNGVEFNNCSFLRCNFFLISVLVPEPFVSTFEAGFQGGIQWLSDPRIGNVKKDKL
jgi:hypothetical protein